MTPQLSNLSNNVQLTYFKILMLLTVHHHMCVCLNILMTVKNLVHFHYYLELNIPDLNIRFKHNNVLKYIQGIFHMKQF